MADKLCAGAFNEQMIDWRHTLHAHPELGFDEHVTATFVAEKLRSFGLEVHERVGAQIVGALQTIVSRKLDPSQNGVVSVTEFETDGLRNILPGRAILSGDARALTPQINAIIERRMRQIVDGLCDAHEIKGRVSYELLFPPTINDAVAVKAAIGAATATVGTSAVDGSCPPKLFSEDFAHFAARRPSCFVLMGNGTEGRYARPLHAADYDFCDAALVYGASYWVHLVEDSLKRT